MSEKYDEYIKEHKTNVIKAFEWMKEKVLPESITIFGEYNEKTIANAEYNMVYKHDESKNDPEEYEAYDKYFYGGNRSFEVVQNFRYAWLHHIHNNPHHWQYWILNNDDPNEGEKILDMPDEYIIEMICDWWSFSWKKGDLEEIFSWYDNRKEYIKMTRGTRQKVESILNLIKFKLNEKEKNNETGND